MADSSQIHEVIIVKFNQQIPSITVSSSWGVILLLILIFLVFGLIVRYFRNRYSWHEMELEISGSPKLKFKVQRNTENIFIANRIWVELTTRKAAIAIDENTDIIIEIYDSWYALFGIIRDEIKSIPGKNLISHDPTSALIGISRSVLNDCMRPHLTEYQAKYRKWYSEAEKDVANEKLSPQKIQEKYPEFQNLIRSMKNVNLALMMYASQLDDLIKGKTT